MDYYEVLIVLHVLLMGYWLGSELVAEGVWRNGWLALSADGLPRHEICTMLCGLDHHPWNALILNIALGFTLAAQVGLVWIDNTALLAIWVASVSWLLLAGYVHRWRARDHQSRLARLELLARYALAAVLAIIALRPLVGAPADGATWLSWKMLLTAALVACSAFVNWQVESVRPARSTPQGSGLEQASLLRRLRLARAGRYLALLLALVIGWLGVMKPA
ncbi:MAG TPA: hypothetical protein VLM41_04660 [Steroidobacteraceae bacterium]|nr:hypothetical protein [Steroidobacteraceae bacterium]